MGRTYIDSQDIKALQELLEQVAVIGERLTGAASDGRVTKNVIEDVPKPSIEAVKKAIELERVDTVDFYLNRHRLKSPKGVVPQKARPKNGILDLLLAVSCGESIIALKERQVGFSAAMASICTQHLAGQGVYDRIVYLAPSQNMMRGFQDKVEYSAAYDIGSAVVEVSKGTVQCGSRVVQMMTAPASLNGFPTLSCIGPPSLVILDEVLFLSEPSVFQEYDNLISSIRGEHGSQVVASLNINDGEQPKDVRFGARSWSSPRYIYLPKEI